jgi:hypothetical protein
VTDPAAPVKVVDVDPAGTVTDVGTGSAVVLFEAIVTVLLSVGAACVSVTVHVVEAPEARLVGVQASDDTLRLGATATVVVVLPPPSVAVSVTV